MMPRAVTPLWATYLVVGAAVLGLRSVSAAPVADGLYVSVGVSATAAVIVGLRRHRPRHRLPWQVLITALLCFNVQDLLSAIGPAVRGAALTAGMVGVVGYLLLVGAVILLMNNLQTDDPEVRQGALLDVGIVVLGGGLLVWQFVVAPAVHGGQGAVADALSASVVPVLELAVLAVILRLAIGAMSQGAAALGLLLGAVCVSLLSGFLHAAAQVNNSHWAGSAAGAIALSGYLLAGAGALHPAMPLLAERSAHRPRIGTGRLPLLVAAGMVGPALLVSAPVLGLKIDPAIVGVAAAGVLLLIVARSTQLLQLVGRQAGQLRTALVEQTRLQEHLRYQAEHDLVTGLPNRAAFASLVESALTGSKGGCAVGFLDLDNFKTVNDQSGHAVGDALLTAVGQRLRGRLRDDDIVARLGGDEYGVFFRDVPDGQTAADLGQRVLDTLTDPFSVAFTTVHVGASLGVAVIPAEDNVEADPQSPRSMDALSNADIAMYAAKRSGKNRCVLYRTAMREQVLGRQQLAADLTVALQAGQLDVHYQPITTMDGARVHGVEALVRWQHQRLGAVEPVELLAAAEEANLVPLVDEFVLRTATRQLAQWQRLLPVAAGLVMGVNAAVETLRRPDYTDVVLSALRSAGLEPSQLVIEVTEQALLEPQSMADRNVSILAELGVGISLDDFGTGYSSLSYLQRLPVRSLKLDGSFARGLPESRRQQQLVRGVVRLSHALGLLVVAEGVENEQQRQILSRLDCDLAQGYLFARPLVSEQLLAYLGERQLAEPLPVTVLPAPRLPG